MTMVRASFPKIIGVRTKMSKHGLSKSKARLILHEGQVRGRKLSKKQRGLFGAVASGKSFKIHNSPAKIGIDSSVEYIK